MRRLCGRLMNNWLANVVDSNCGNVWRGILRNVTTCLVQIADALTGVQNRLLRYRRWLLWSDSPSMFLTVAAIIVFDIRTKANKGICSCLRGRGECFYTPISISVEVSGPLQSVCTLCCISSKRSTVEIETDTAMCLLPGRP